MTVAAAQSTSRKAYVTLLTNEAYLPGLVRSLFSLPTDPPVLLLLIVCAFVDLCSSF